jgi:peptide-methionine (S)-S-oxide reductase
MSRLNYKWFVVWGILFLNSPDTFSQNIQNQNTMNDRVMETATFGAGCFWCVEAVFQQLKGVVAVESGYSGGRTLHPTYKEVCSGTTGHAEVCRIVFDPSIIRFSELLEVFWKTHDPTTENRQGADIGTQYRSVIFYHNEEQRLLAEEMKAKLNLAGIWNNPLVTEIIPAQPFYKAENYHQEYYFQNADQPYCTTVITPKIDKFRKIFADKLKQR